MASQTPVGRAASDNMPQSAAPALDRASKVVDGADSVLLSVRDTFETNEGRRLLNAGRQFVLCFFHFALMLIRGIMSFIEARLGLEAADQNLPSRFVGVCGCVTTMAKERAERVERHSDGTAEAWMCSRLRKGIDVTSSLFRSLLKSASQFSGPGKQYVVPTAESVITSLPQDLQKSIRESPGPVNSIRAGLGLDTDLSSTTATAAEPPCEKQEKIE